jgi:hypothetical protein
VADLGPGPLDVVATYRLFEPPFHVVGGAELGRPAAAVDPAGRVFFAASDGIVDAGLVEPTCGVVRVDDSRLGATTWMERGLCSHEPWVMAYDPLQDLLVVGALGLSDYPVLQFRDPDTFELAWALTPRDLGAPDTAAAAPVQDVLEGLYTTEGWRCNIVLEDEGDAAVVACFTFGGGDPRIAMINRATRSIEWARALALPAAINVEDVDVPAGIADVADMTLAEGRIVVPLLLNDPPDRAVLWLAEDGTPVGMRSASQATGRPWLQAGQTYPDASRWATRAGSLAVLAMWEQVVFIDPASGAEPRQAPAGEQFDTSTSLGWAGPIADREHVVVPFDREIRWYTLDGAPTSTMWAGQGWYIGDMIAAGDGTAYAMLLRLEQQGRQGGLVRLDLRSGAELQLLPLPVAPSFPENGALLPLGGDRGLMLLTRSGDAVLLAASEPADRPILGLEDQYPRPNAVFGLDVGLPENAQAIVQVLVHWGDGSSDAADGASRLEHTYRDAGLHTVRATLVYADGRTATTESTIDVGGTPDLNLNFMQRAFADDKVDTTWGIIGLVVVLIGAIVAVGRRRRHHSALQDELAKLRDIRAAGLDDPAAAARSLEGYEQRITGDLSTRRLNDAQFSVLRLEVSDVRRTLRKRAVAPMAGIVSPTFRLALDAALEDGRITGDEADALLRALRRERGLHDAQRVRVRQFIQQWTHAAGP